MSVRERYGLECSCAHLKRARRSASLVHVSKCFLSFQTDTVPAAILAKAENISEAPFLSLSKTKKLVFLSSFHAPSRRPLTNAIFTLDLAVKS